MCGEKLPRSVSEGSSSGSPPHVRGKALAPPVRAAVERITPACAGKSDWDEVYVKLVKDHPRVCGEKFDTPGFYIVLPGSPPRMRGKVLCSFPALGCGGITPAYAGKSFTSFYHCTTFWDHPRVCGEKSRHFLCPLFPLGSPPRMRGKVFNNFHL